MRFGDDTNKTFSRDAFQKELLTKCESTLRTDADAVVCNATLDQMLAKEPAVASYYTQMRVL